MRRRHVIGDELDGLVEAVHDTRRDGVEPVGLAADDDGGDHEHGHGRHTAKTQVTGSIGTPTLRNCP